MKRLVAALVLAVGSMLGLAVPAFAHNVLIGSDPKDGASVEAGPKQVTLTFDLPIQIGDFDVVTVNGPGGSRWEAGAATVSSNEISAPVRPLGPAGDYLIGYRILSADGHPVSGQVRFSLTKAGNGTPNTATAGTDQTGTTSDSGSMPAWPWVAGGVLLLVVGVVVALRLGGTSDEPLAGPSTRRRDRG